MKNKTAKSLLSTGWLIGIATGLILLFLLISGIRSCSSDSPSANKEGSSQNQNNSSGQSGGETTNYYPSSGSGQATVDKPIKAYLNPAKTWTDAKGGGIKYVLEDDPSVFFERKQGEVKKWAGSLPAGNYLVYPYGSQKIGFSWGQGTPPD